MLKAKDRGLSRTRKGNKASLHKEAGLLVFLLILSGCTIPETDPSRYNCTWTEDHVNWSCVKDGIKFNCEYER